MWVGSRSGPPAQASAGRERAIEAVGGGAEPGQNHAPGGAGKKVLKPSRRGPAVEYLCDRYRVSERHACSVLRVPRATYRYRSCADPRTELRMRIRELARARVRYGYRRIRVLLNREGWNVGRYLVYRLYKEEGLTLKKRPARRKRVAAVPRQEKIRATRPNQVWSLDFVSDQLADGRRFRALRWWTSIPEKALPSKRDPV